MWISSYFKCLKMVVYNSKQNKTLHWDKCLQPQWQKIFNLFSCGCVGIQNTNMCWFIYYSQLHSLRGKNLTHYTTKLSFPPQIQDLYNILITLIMQRW